MPRGQKLERLLIDSAHGVTNSCDRSREDRHHLHAVVQTGASVEGGLESPHRSARARREPGGWMRLIKPPRGIHAVSALLTTPPAMRLITEQCEAPCVRCARPHTSLPAGLVQHHPVDGFPQDQHASHHRLTPSSIAVQSATRHNPSWYCAHEGVRSFWSGLKLIHSSPSLRC